VATRAGAWAILGLILVSLGAAAWAQTGPSRPSAPAASQSKAPATADPANPDTGFRFSLDPKASDSGMTLQLSGPLRVLFLLTLITLIPAVVMMMTSFTRIVIVLGFLRSALGTQQIPPNQVMIGLALFLTTFVMAPTLQDVNEKALRPYLANEIGVEAAISRGLTPLRVMMYRQTREADIALMVQLAKMDRPKSLADVPTHVLVPAFIVSELKTAFEMGFIIYVPFLVIDMVVASTLMSMGMMMLPPVIISMPFKLLLFVLVDGWHVIVRSLVTSFG